MRYLYAFLVWLGAAAAWADGMVALEGTYPVDFDTISPSTAAPENITGTATISVYEQGSSTPILTGVSVTTGYNSVTGANYAEIAATTANGFDEGKIYNARLAGSITVGGVSQTGRSVARFRVTTLITAAGIQDECEDALAAYFDATITLPSAGAPPATPTRNEVFRYVYASFRNKQTVDSNTNEVTVFADDGTTELWTYTTGDTTGVFTRGEAAAP